MTPLYTAKTWPHLDMLGMGWVVCGSTAIRVEDIGERVDKGPMSASRNYWPSVRVWQETDRWDLVGVVASPDLPPKPWTISVLPYTTMSTKYIHGFATEADAQAIAVRILAASGAWDAPTEGTGADGE